MAKYTKKRIMETFEEMLDEMSFSKITVSELVNRSEISSNTFYYHFSDIFCLLDAWLEKQAEEYVKETIKYEDWADKIKFVLQNLKANSKRVYHISNAVSRERLERYIFTRVEERFYSTVEQYMNKNAVEEETMRKVSNFFCYALLGFLLKFLWEGMKADIDSSVDDFFRIFRGIFTSDFQGISTANGEYPEKPDIGSSK